MSAPTRFKNGVTNQNVGSAFANMREPVQLDYYKDFTDFNQYVAGDWTVTNTTSHATIGLVAGVGGQIAIAGGASSASTDVGAIQSNPLDFNFSTTQQVWFRTRIKVETALNNQILVGLTSSNATVAPSDGIYFNKAAAAATVDFVVRKSSTSTTQTTVATMADNTFIDLAFYYNGKDAVDVYVNDVKVYSQTTLTNLPTAVALGAGIATKLAATAPTTSVFTCDYLYAAQDRSI